MSVAASSRAGARRAPRARVGALAALALLAGACGPADGPIRSALLRRIDPTRKSVAGLQSLVVRFYKERQFRPGWTSAIGARREAFELAVALDRLGSEGVEPRSDRVRRMHALLSELRPSLFGPAPNPLRLAELDELLTRAWFECANQLLGGRIHPQALPIDWRTGPRRADLVASLERALKNHRIGASLRELQPTHRGYVALRAAVDRYRGIAAAGGWRRVRPGARLAVGSSGARVAALRARLAAEDDRVRSGADSTVFDRALGAAVLRFQKRYGLDTTGVVDRGDAEALDVPVTTRVRQMELNLERWRWLPDTLGERHLIVNIPEFTLRVVEAGRVTSAIRVIVGKPENPTPVLSAALRYVVFNPLWHVPARIAANEVLAEVQKDPEYLARNNIRVYDGTERGAHELDPYSIPWHLLSPDDLPYAFRQDPGPENPVGHIKFMCPNPFDVYLHDTPSGHLFQRRVRAFSHGCVRVEKPLVIAEWVLHGRPEWDLKGIQAAIDTSSNFAVTVADPIPVHIFYFTAWVDDEGAVEFRRDLYGLDDLLDRALRGQPLPTREQLDEMRLSARGQTSPGPAADDGPR
jgi:L,D-transpeptidase YcbB